MVDFSSIKFEKNLIIIINFICNLMRFAIYVTDMWFNKQFIIVWLT